MKELFDSVKKSILHGMPSGCLVTKGNIDFDIGMWQHKTYENSADIYKYLRSKWTPHTINLIIIDDADSLDGVKGFVSDNAMEVHGRDIYLVYCIAIKTSKVTDDFCKFLESQSFLANTYRQKIMFGDYTVFVCQFVEHLLVY